MLPSHIRQRLYKHLTPVQALRSFDPVPTRLFRLMDDLLVDFIEGLDMVGSEGYGDEDEVFMALFDVFHDSVGGLGAKPGGGADLRLPAEAVRVGEVEALHHGVDGGGDFGGIGVSYAEASVSDIPPSRRWDVEHTSVHHTHRQTMRRE